MSASSLWHATKQLHLRFQIILKASAQAAATSVHIMYTLLNFWIDVFRKFQITFFRLSNNFFDRLLHGIDAHECTCNVNFTSPIITNLSIDRHGVWWRHVTNKKESKKDLSTNEWRHSLLVNVTCQTWH